VYLAWEGYLDYANKSSGEINDSTIVKKGVSKTDLEEMSHLAGVDVSGSYGIGGF
jgi:hypothetical protein